jgi:hypothetical protein
MRTSNKRRCWVCSYLLWQFPFTKYQRWFYNQYQAEAFLARQKGVMLQRIDRVNV